MQSGIAKVPVDFEIDNLDRKILAALLADARTPFSDLAKRLHVSDGTIHVRYNKLREVGAITGAHIAVNPAALGLGVCVYIGINLDHARDYAAVLERLKIINEVIEAHYTTGNYNIFVKVRVKDIHELHHFLVHTLQPIKGIHSTETLLVLDTPVERTIHVQLER